MWDPPLRFKNSSLVAQVLKEKKKNSLPWPLVQYLTHRKVMVVSVPNNTWAGAQASPVVWRQPRLPGEDSLASEGKRPFLAD